MNSAHLISAALGSLAVLSTALILWQWIAARRFPLHRRVVAKDFSPAITLLKPVKGCDATTFESLQSWFRQDYSGAIQILFGVADENDPARELIQRLIRENPQADAELVVCGENLGMNAKVSKLAQLERHARHDLILISDADVRVPPDFLASFVAPLQDEKTALVNCFYRLANPMNLAMRWEAIAINADFWSQVLQSASLKPLDFALGAAILVRRESLAAIGGFRALADCLADDYQLGHRIAKNGHRIALSTVVVECWDPPMDWTKVWKHQLRWARTIRVCQPGPYFLSILGNATFWPALWLAVSLFTAGKCAHVTAIIAGILIFIRIVVARALQLRFTPGRRLVAPFWLVPVKDFFQLLLWLSAFAGNTVEWRGRKMKMRRDGTLIAPQ